MHKGLIAFIVVAGIALLFAGALFIKKSTDEAFKTVNESLKKSNAYIDSANKKLLDSIIAKHDK